MIAALLPLPPVIDQTIHRVPLDPWSALGFVAVIAASAYLAFRRSPIILAVLAFAVPFAGYRDIGSTTLTVEKCLAFGTAVGLLLSGVPVLPKTAAARRVFLVGCLLLAAVAISGWHAVFPMHTAREFFKQAEYLVLLWCAATLMEQTLQGERALLTGAVAGTAIVATLGLLQGIFGGAPSGIWINGHPVPRVAGTLEGPNQLAGFLEAALPLIWIAPLIIGRMPLLYSYVCAVSCGSLVLTQSRAGILVAALTYGVLLKINSKIARASVIPTIVGSLCGFLVIVGWLIFWAHASLADIDRLLRFTSLQPPGGVGTRAQLWHAAVMLFRSHPLTGVGAGNYELLLPRVGLSGVQTQANSLYLQTLAEQGVVGFVMLLVFAFVALRETFRLRLRSPLALAAFLAFVSLLAHQLVDDLFFFPKAASLAWLLLGAGTALPLRAEAPSPVHFKIPAVQNVEQSVHELT